MRRETTCFGCAEHGVLRTDAVINREAATLWRRDSGAARGRLWKAQRAWLTYRSAACASAADEFAGGSLAPVAAAECQLRITRERMADLKALLSPEG
jgi:uncharacterized protein YecT (DUF1311 family)